LKNINWILFILGCCNTAAINAQADVKPNIIFIVIDDLNDYTDDLGGLPLVSTPNISRISEKGTSFNNTVCPAPLCCPSRTSFLTGKDPGYTKIYSADNYDCSKFSNNFTIAKGNKEYYTLPGYLKDSAGYFTFGLNKIFHCYAEKQEYDSVTLDPCAKNLSWNKLFLYVDTAILSSATFVTEEGTKNNEWSKINDTLEPYMMDVVAIDSSIKFIKDFSAGEGTCGKPFFLALGIKKPHKPLYIPAKYFVAEYIEDFSLEPFDIPYNFPANTYPSNGITMPPQPEIPNSDFYSLPTNGLAQSMIKNADLSFYDWAENLVDKPIINPNYTDSVTTDLLAWSKRANFVMAYVAGIKYLDAQIGRLLDSLEAFPEVYNNTIIILAGDNGFSLGEKTHWGKRAMWETDVRVPLIIADLRNPNKNSSNTMVNLMDIFPTVCEMAEVPYPTFLNGNNYLDGKSVVHLMQNSDAIIERPQLSSVRKEINSEGYCFPQYSVRNDRFHYIKYQSNGGGLSICDSINTSTEEELYEIGTSRKTDPNEWYNLINKSAFKPVVTYLAQWLPDSNMYLKQTYKAFINNNNTECYAEENTILNLNALIYDTAGVLVENIPEMQFIWTNNITDDTLFGTAVDFNIGGLPSSAFESNTDLFIYFSIINPNNNAIIGFDIKNFKVSNAESPEINFSLIISDVNQVIVNNVILDNDIKNWWWEINGDSVFYGAVPGLINYLNTDTLVVTCNAIYGNNDCLTSFTKTLFDDANLISELNLQCIPNPANNETLLYLNNSLLNGELTIFSVSGTVVQKINLSNNYTSTWPINTADLLPGMYLVGFKGKEALIITKLMVMH